jgi:hypothetical protein
MPEQLFISQADLNEYAPANDTLNPFDVEAAILMAQDLHLKPVMGRKWYEEFQGELSGTLSPANALAYPYIKKLLSYATYVVLRTQLLDNVTNTGVTVLTTPWENQTEKERFDMKSRMYAQASTQASEDLTNYLIENLDDYPLYKEMRFKAGQSHPKGWFA